MTNANDVSGTFHMWRHFIFSKQGIFH